MQTDKINITADKHDTAQGQTEGQPVTAPWQKSGFSGYINSSASNKLLWWLDSFVLLSPLLRQAAKRYRQPYDDIETSKRVTENEHKSQRFGKIKRGATPPTS